MDRTLDRHLISYTISPALSLGMRLGKGPAGDTTSLNSDSPFHMPTVCCAGFRFLIPRCELEGESRQRLRVGQ